MYFTITTQSQGHLSNHMTYPSAVHGVVDTSKFLDGCCDEILHTLFITYVQLNSKELITRMPSNAFALLGSFLGTFVVEIREDNTSCPSFRISERGCFADA